MKRYNPKDIEQKWQDEWAASKIYEATEDPTKPKRYVLEYFPYPSGAAMHVGHVRNYTIGDAVARFYRMRGYNVMHPMGWDAFGLPAENFAIKNNISPQQAIAQNTGRFKQQLMQMGFSYDWSREINSSDPAYYKWTQWFFKLLFERGLAYQKEQLQWWCETDKTVLANEQVEAGRCWRCGNEVTKKALKQWFFKITDYADRLVEDLEDLDWSDAIKSMQRNWIGKSKGAEIDFTIDGSDKALKVFTTRPDTLFGATFMVIAPEHPLTEQLTTPEQKKHVATYVKATQAKSDVERQETSREKTGVFTGAYVINPINGEKIPVWIADYVLMGYGTGAIMAVPAHDQRDHEFAKKFELPIINVVDPVAIREDAKDKDYFVEKQKIVAVVQNDDGELLTINWGPTLGGRLFIGGTVEGKESPEETALREVAEETGYTDLELLEVGQETFHYKYFAFSKQEAHSVEAKFVYFKLRSDKQQAQKLDDSEKNNFTVEWISRKQADQDIVEPLHRYTFNKFILGESFHGEGVMVNSGKYDGLPSSEARDKIVADLSQQYDEVPLFTQTEEPGAFREGEPIVERQAITAIVKHWSEDKYLGLKWKKVDWDTFITGGIEDGQTAEEAAIREIQEETGYKNPVLKRDLGKTEAVFFHVPKKENRHAHFDCLYFELADGERAEMLAEEQAIHDVVWLTRDEVESFRLPASHRFVWKKLTGQALGPAQEVTNYKIRDWLISRQRYWGAPIPIVYCKKDGAVAVPDDQLPVVLPEVESYQPTGEGSVLAGVKDWVNTTCPTCGGPATRETDTMDGFACSSWYFLRFADPHNDKAPFDPAKVKFWLPVDDYIGGAEHAVMHLLYARMWTKVMNDAGLIDFAEPFKSLRNHGMILAPDGRKMSKSWGNVIAPDELIDQGYGADAIRIMELFIGPWDQQANWSVEGMGGCFRFLQRVWTLVQEHLEAAQNKPADTEVKELEVALHKTIKRVSDDLHEMGFNTAIAAQMELVNKLYKLKLDNPLGSQAWQGALSTFMQLLAPFAPHMAEELWHQLGHEDSVHVSEWPLWNEALLIDDTITIVVQVNGKVRARLEVAADADEATVTEVAKAHERVAGYLEGQTIKKTIYVPGKLVSFVV